VSKQNNSNFIVNFNNFLCLFRCSNCKHNQDDSLVPQKTPKSHRRIVDDSRTPEPSTSKSMLQEDRRRKK
jgi:hypothetical protein